MVGGPSLFQILELSLPILGTVIANKIWLKQKVKTKSIFPNQREMVNFGPKSKAYQGSIKLGKPTNVWVSFFIFQRIWLPNHRHFNADGFCLPSHGLTINRGDSFTSQISGSVSPADPKVHQQRITWDKAWLSKLSPFSHVSKFRKDDLKFGKSAKWQ